MKNEEIKRYEKYKDSGIPWIGETNKNEEMKELSNEK